MAEEIINNGDNGAGTDEATLTQTDVDRIVSQRLVRAQRDMPTADEINGYRAWKTAQQTEADKLKKITTARDSAVAELGKANAKIEQYEREKLLMAKGIPAEDIAILPRCIV